MESLFLMGAVQALFFTALVLTKRKKSASDFLLALWLFFLAAHLLIPFYIFKNFPDNIHLAGTDTGLFISHTILLYLYASMLSGSKTPLSHYVFHGIMILLTNCLMQPLILTPREEKIKIASNQGQPSLFLALIIIVIYLVSFFYLYLTLRRLSNYKQRIRNEFSNIENINLNWLYALTIGLLLFYCISFCGGILLFLLKINLVYIDFFTYSLLALLVYAIGFFGFRQGRIFVYDTSRTIPPEKREKSEESEDKEDKEKKGETPAAASENVPGKKTLAEESKTAEKSKNEDTLFSQKMKLLMDEQKPYLDNELTLYNLAARLETTPHHVSRLLNNSLGTTFYDFINSYRIKEVKKRMSSGEYKNYTLIAIAFDSGFNSKASFNRIFKKQTGLTPSQYLKETLKEKK